MSTNRRAVCLAVTSAGTAVRCTILLNRSTKTTIVTEVEPARRAQASRADKPRKHERTCVPTCTGDSNRSHA
ncbi:hypothetical protein PR002_g16345 [Phytophthora rubi]|uniref:Uncharacterized protein n=1 Tax=Phytophthora rubi TaxID=129364 RepID=A0A6A3KMC8_9STRA|nr:hypothetical protein PR002_g16345 [Phytophthora rubi]